MIIDVIFDRQGFEQDGIFDYYDKGIVDYIGNEESLFGFDYGIADAIRSGNEKNAKKGLCRYIDKQGYSPAIKKYVKSVNWCI